MKRNIHMYFYFILFLKQFEEKLQFSLFMVKFIVGQSKSQFRVHERGKFQFVKPTQ